MDKVKSYIEANKERFISELFDLLRIPSISAQSERKPDMQRCAEFLAAALVKAGADRADVLHGRRSNPNGSPFYWQSTFIPWIGFKIGRAHV